MQNRHTTTREPPNMPEYQDYMGTRFPDIDALVEYRIRHRAPQLGRSECPAAEYTFAVFNDDGDSWRNPDTDTKQRLRNAVADHQYCCLDLGAECPLSNLKRKIPTNVD